MLLPFLLSTLLAVVPEAPAQENLIAPLPVAALRSKSASKLKMSTFEISPIKDARRRETPVKLQLKPDQSLMGVIVAKDPARFRLNFTNTFHQPITGGPITRVGDKVFLINRLHRDLDVVCEVDGNGSLMDEPYELVLCEIDTVKALAEPTGL